MYNKNKLMNLIPGIVLISSCILSSSIYSLYLIGKLFEIDDEFDEDNFN